MEKRLRMARYRKKEEVVLINPKVDKMLTHAFPVIQLAKDWRKKKDKIKRAMSKVK